MALEKFTYKVGTRTISLPKFDNIPFGTIRKLRKESKEEQFFGLLESVAAAKDLALIDTLGQKEVADLMDAWQKDSGVSLGESSAS